MNTKEIKLKIHEESDLYSPFDPDQKLISEDVASYIAQSYLNKHRSIKEQYNIRIISDTPVNEEKVRKAFSDYYSQELDNLSFDLKGLTLKQVCLGVFGAVVLAIWVILSATKAGVNMEILSIIGWVAVWEATSIAIMTRPELRRLKRSFERGLNAGIIVDIEKNPAE